MTDGFYEWWNNYLRNLRGASRARTGQPTIAEKTKKTIAKRPARATGRAMRITGRGPTPRRK